MMCKVKIFAIVMCLFGVCVNLLAQRPGSNNPHGAREMHPMGRGGMMPGGRMGPFGGMGGINQFDVEFTTEVPHEQDWVIKDKTDSLYRYFVEHVKFDRVVKLTFSNDDVQIVGLPDGILVEKEGAYLVITSTTTEPMAFELSGKSENGSLVFNMDAPLKLLFNNLVLKSQRGDAILVNGKSHVYAVLTEGSMNELSDCRNPEMPPMMQGFPPMRMEGGGMPNLGGGMSPMGEMSFQNHAREENPEDYHVQYGIRMKKPQMKKKLKLDGTFVCSGSLTISGKGSLQVQSNNKVGIKSKASLMIRPGNMITVRALSGKGVNAKNELYMYGGTLNVDCTFSEDKALTCGRNMYIKGGHVVIKAAGGEASEGMQSKFLMKIDGGVVEVAAQDDAINAQGDLVINGGVVKAYSLTNDAIDSNCNLIINGGDVFASGYGMPEGGLDSSDESGYRLFINGGTVTAIGGRHSMPDKQSRQPSVQWHLGQVEMGKTYGINDVCSYKSSREYQMGGASLLFSSPKLKKGTSYSLTIDGEPKELIESLNAPFSNVGNEGRHFPF